MLYIQLYDMQHFVGILILCQSDKKENICILKYSDSICSTSRNYAMIDAKG